MTFLSNIKLIIFVFLAYSTRKPLLKRNDFGIVNIVKERTPIGVDYEISSNKIPSAMDTIVQQTFVSPTKRNFNEDIQPQKPITTTEQLAEQTAQTFDDIRK
jgi:hypothetical protein